MKFPPTATTARISEIFSSLQGEGPRLGEKHIFLRFEECHIHCKYCDELDKKGKDWHVDEVLKFVDQLQEESGPHAFLSLTGGEPLMYTPFIETLVPLLRAKGLKIYLETDGILWKTLEKYVHLFDYVSMDLKTSSVTGERNFDNEHRKFLNVLVEKGKEYYLKIVVSKEIDLQEYDQQIELVSEIAPESCLVLQPITNDIEGHQDVELMRLIEQMQKNGMKKLNDVRIVPRFHKIIGVR